MAVELLNGNYESSVFPGGEVHVRIHKATPRSYIRAVLNNSQDVMQLLLLCDALKRFGSSIGTLEIPYVPYARQDRVCNRGEAFSIKVMCDLINSIGAEKVFVADPHSDVTMALLDRAEIIDLTKHGLEEAIGTKLVICPDAGAEKRILKLKKPYVMATKVRDVTTGEIKETKLYGDVTSRDCIIVDDICDGGRTFIELAKVLRANGASSVDLYVTHGLFSKGMFVFKGLLDNIFAWEPQSGVVRKVWGNTDVN